MACISAAGHYVSPFVVMKGQCQNDNYEIYMPPGTKVVISHSGYMELEQFSMFIDHFIAAKPAGTIILILDGHGPNYSDFPTIEKAVTNDISLLCLLSHTTNKLRSLDVSFCGPLKKHYNKACRIHLRKNSGKWLNKVVFGGIFAEAWSKAHTVGNDVNGFKACGIFPINQVVSLSMYSYQEWSTEGVVEAQDEVEIVSPNQEPACVSPASSTSTAE
ncbi:hypothetical protein PR048_020904 [Dryococelus australis]|uniref:DDE-1 domain-containing protein n=1 Tax=Dryococelus australis TaxID=614101 RepID=A0ABQ9GWT3_9NEOP|nr:hypothetical protein PR048_020904 [Dryococelus australis]